MQSEKPKPKFSIGVIIVLLMAIQSCVDNTQKNKTANQQHKFYDVEDCNYRRHQYLQVNCAMCHSPSNHSISQGNFVFSDLDLYNDSTILSLYNKAILAKEHKYLDSLMLDTVLLWHKYYQD